MHRANRLTFALTGATAASFGYTLVTDDEPLDTLPGLAVLSVAASYYELAAPDTPAQ